MRLHIDTDFAGDPDDACALAMVLGWPGVEVMAITTTDDPDGRRADYVRHFLSLLGRSDIPVAVGAGTSIASGRTMGEIADPGRYWAMPVPRCSPGAATCLDLLERSAQGGATFTAIGPYTNLALFEQDRPGVLSTMRVVAMGGWVHPPDPPLPQWGPSRDWNVQADTAAARVLVDACGDLTLVAMPAAMTATLRARDLPRLVESGPVGTLLTRQSLAHRDDNGYVDLGRDEPALPDDLVNFHWDPVTCAVAIDWEGADVEQLQLVAVTEDGALRFVPGGSGRRTGVVTAVDGDAFARTWLERVTAAQRGSVSGTST